MPLATAWPRKVHGLLRLVGQIQQILSLGESSGQSDILREKLAQANQFANTAMPEGRGGYGKPYTAPSPLEVIGNLALRYAGMRQANDIQASRARSSSNRPRTARAFSTPICR